jgi:hypothetical protein
VECARSRPLLLKYMAETGKYSPQLDKCNSGFLKNVLSLSRDQQSSSYAVLDTGSDKRMPFAQGSVAGASKVAVRCLFP